MNKDLIEKARNKYIELMKAKAELEEVKTALLMEKQTHEIKKCLSVIEREESKIPSEDEILRYSFYNVEEEESTCNIFVFIGAYRRNDNMNDINVSDYTKTDYFVYQNLEKMFSGVVIYPQNQKQFEKENVVLRFSDSSNIREKFYKLQSLYFREYLNEDNISQDKLLVKLRKNL